MIVAHVSGCSKLSGTVSVVHLYGTEGVSWKLNGCLIFHICTVEIIPLVCRKWVELKLLCARLFIRHICHLYQRESICCRCSATSFPVTVIDLSQWRWHCTWQFVYFETRQGEWQSLVLIDCDILIFQFAFRGLSSWGLLIATWTRTFWTSLLPGWKPLCLLKRATSSLSGPGGNLLHGSNWTKCLSNSRPSLTGRINGASEVST